MNIELKPCPFCGNEATLETFATVRERKPRYRVICKECRIETSWDNFSEEEALNLWNRRADK